MNAARMLVLVMFAAACAVNANAQDTAATNDAPPSEDAIKQRNQELDALREQQKNSAELQQRLKDEIAAIGQDRAKLNQQLIDIAARVRTIESSIADTEGRIRPLDAREAQIRATLDSRRDEIAEVLAALQRAGRRAPPALLVTPEDSLKSLRTAMLLGAAVPELRTRATELASNLNELIALRKNISGEHDRLAADRDRLNEDQTRLAALVEERQKNQAAAERDIEAEKQRAAALSKQASGLQDLIGKMEQDLKSAAKAAATAELKGTPANINGKPDLREIQNQARLSPAIAFAAAKGLLPLPVNGTKIRNFGGPDGTGGQEKGISVATMPGAQVTSPCDGWVVYAGPFRSYGQLLILNAGGGYHVLIAGMDRISVNIGQFVLTGEPVATMGSQSQVASILAAPTSQPILYIEFRKDGTPIDPGPWWAAKEGEKVRG
ncbi:MAG: peptidoglycan DD-metalloendopeptidase family protein [Xanthobacteraceae bacterium]|nr:peptidoglycan DD-metalloendopeptidase family protein [Xanthobacteraceae bacterium]